MQQQIHSYAFQLGEGYLGKNIVCHPKNPEFLVCASSQQQQQSIIYSLLYDQENPRKSKLTSKKISGSICGLYGSTQQNFCLSVTKANDKYQINQFYYNSSQGQQQISESNNQSKQSSKIYETSAPILNLLHNKAKNTLLTTPKEIFIMDWEKKQIKETLISLKEQEQSNVTYSVFDPIHQYLAYVIDNKNIHITDKSCKKDKYVIQTRKNLSNCEELTSIDFNPNKQYYMIANFPSSTKFYDIRKPTLPIKILDHQYHHSLIEDSKYNHSHDQLILTSYDDGTVGLLRVVSVSSVPMSKDQDVMVRLYDEHQDSICDVCWSNFSPWVFGSLGWSAVNFVVNIVPSAQKYRILL